MEILIPTSLPLNFPKEKCSQETERGVLRASPFSENHFFSFRKLSRTFNYNGIKVSGEQYFPNIDIILPGLAFSSREVAAGVLKKGLCVKSVSSLTLDGPSTPTRSCT